MEGLVRLFTQQCLSVHNIRTNDNQGIITVALVSGNKADADKYKESIFYSYEQLYPLEYPKNFIVVYLNGNLFNDNYQSVYDWVSSMIESKRIDSDKEVVYGYEK